MIQTTGHFNLTFKGKDDLLSYLLLDLILALFY